MGYPYTELIVPAILYSNPGVNRYELSDLLKNVHYSMKQYSPEDAWDYFDPEWEFNDSFGGLNNLASSLKLKTTNEFNMFQENNLDDNGLKVEAPFLVSFDYSKQNFEVIVHESNVLKKERNVYNEFSYRLERISKGDLFAGGIVQEILREKKFKDNPENELDFEMGPFYEYDLKIIPVKQVKRLETFFSEKQLYEQYPLFDPNKKYDWSKREGVISTGMFSEGRYFWKQKRDKYYLDEKTFDFICEGFSTGLSFGYTDLIMTSEAIKNKAWKLLSYKGFVFIDDFLKDFPISNALYKQAVYDAHFSIFAKNKNMTISDLMRLRLINKFKG